MAKVNLRAYNREIETMMDRGQLDEAVAHCHHIFKTFPKHLETYRLLGKVYLEYKRYKEAVDIFSRVLTAVPDDFVANVGMSIVRDEENKLDDAIWHMERAFETQPSNSAIQGELQRLYGRRDGVQPPRIRMTRGALAHMYVQGELYPQAISEIKSVLKEDAGRGDMQALLAYAHYRSGQKNEAVEAASALLKRYPYCLDANRVLAEILGAERLENAQAYRQRVFELDPYASQVTGSLFQSKDALDAAVSIEHLEWNGQPVGGSADWHDSKAIKLDSGAGRGRDEQPEWLKNASRESAPTVHAKPQTAPAFDTSTPPAQPTPTEEIPDFLRAAGWGQSTGTFDESKPSFAEETPASSAQPLAQGDMPDWVKAMAPKQEAQPAAEEEMPDWINKIGPAGAGAAAVASSGDMDWLSGLGEPSQPAPSEQPAGDQPDWLKQFSAPASSSAPSSTDQPDWLRGFGDETPPAQKSEEPDWLSQFGAQPQAAESKPASDDFDFLRGLAEQPPAPAQPAPAANVEELGKSQSEIDDSLAWLENLAAKQGATEGLLIKPEDRMEKEPDWVQQAKSAPQPPVTPPAANVEELGKSQSEIDDSLAWLENLAAKQGATEGLLVKPEDRMEKEPDWVQQVKSAPQPPVTPPAANVEELGKSQSEIDDSLAWLENLAAKQGATEGLLVKPEDRMEKEPDWVQQVKSAPQALAQPPVEQPVPAQDTASWLRSLDAEDEQSEPEFVEDETAVWLKSLDGADAAPVPVQPERVADDLPAWMQPIGEEKPVETAPAVPASEADESAWMKSLAEPVAPVSPKAAEEGVPGWLSGLEKEEEQVPMSASQGDLPSWLRDETGEVVAEPTKIEPTRSTDWKPAEVKREEIPAPPPVVAAKPEPKLEPKPEPRPEPKPEPKPVKKAPVKAEVKPATPPEPYKEPVTRRATGMLTMPIDPILHSARTELSRSNIPGALETYGKLIKKGRFLDEAIFDLREALYRYPVEVSIWQTLGDAYMRANRLQDALDAYTKAEELLR